MNVHNCTMKMVDQNESRGSRVRMEGSTARLEVAAERMERFYSEVGVAAANMEAVRREGSM